MDIQNLIKELKNFKQDIMQVVEILKTIDTKLAELEKNPSAKEISDLRKELRAFIGVKADEIISRIDKIFRKVFGV
jgi:hypothetical protein